MDQFTNFELQENLDSTLMPNNETNHVASIFNFELKHLHEANTLVCIVLVPAIVLTCCIYYK